MSNKVNHRRKRGHIRGRDGHTPGRAVAGCSCGPWSQVEKRRLVERIARDGRVQLADGVPVQNGRLVRVREPIAVLRAELDY